jgi:hypothetical protein
VLAEERYGALTVRFTSAASANSPATTLAQYKPVLEEVERILAEAGLDEEEIRRGAQAGPVAGKQGLGESRHRR